MIMALVPAKPVAAALPALQAPLILQAVLRHLEAQLHQGLALAGITGCLIMEVGV